MRLDSILEDEESGERGGHASVDVWDPLYIWSQTWSPAFSERMATLDDGAQLGVATDQIVITVTPFFIKKTTAYRKR